MASNKSSERRLRTSSMFQVNAEPQPWFRSTTCTFRMECSELCDMCQYQLNSGASRCDAINTDWYFLKPDEPSTRRCLLMWSQVPFLWIKSPLCIDFASILTIWLHCFELNIPFWFPPPSVPPPLDFTVMNKKWEKVSECLQEEHTKGKAMKWRCEISMPQ